MDSLYLYLYLLLLQGRSIISNLFVPICFPSSFISSYSCSMCVIFVSIIIGAYKYKTRGFIFQLGIIFMKFYVLRFFSPLNDLFYMYLFIYFVAFSWSLRRVFFFIIFQFYGIIFFRCCLTFKLKSCDLCVAQLVALLGLVHLKFILFF